MAPTVTNQLQLTILATEDGSNVVLVNRSATPAIDDNVADFIAYGKTPDAALHAVPFPSGYATINHFYIKNNAGAGSLLISITPTGGALVSAALLGPGDCFVYWQDDVGAPAVGGVTQGLTAVSVTGSAANIAYEYFMGA